MKTFSPMLLSIKKEGYNYSLFFKDLIAGIIVAIVALPLAIAFGIASGVTPQQGIVTAIIAGILISLLGGTKVQIGSPTGAFVVIIFGIIQKYGYNGLAIATIMAGILLIFMGLTRMGSVIKFIPYPVTVGFTTGIGVLIFSGQVNHFLGYTITDIPSDFIPKWITLFQNIHTTNFWSMGIATGSMIIILKWPHFSKKIPGSLIAIIAATIVVHLFDLPVATIGSRFGSVPSSLPIPSLPSITFNEIKMLISPAVTIALLAGIESLLSAVVSDGMTGDKHNSNTELIALGVANIASPLFGGIPATGAIARTATNIRNGGKTPLVGIIHSITLLLILLFMAKWAVLIPMPVLSAILMVVAYNMSELHLFKKIFKSPRSDILVLLATFFLTILIDLTVAIQVGVVLASLLFMHRMSNVTQTVSLFNNQQDDADHVEDPFAISKRDVPKGIEVFEINGPFFFGAADRFRDHLSTLGYTPKVLILRMRHVLTIDATAIKALEDLIEKTQKEGTQLLLSGIHAQPLMALEKADILKQIGTENCFFNIDESLKAGEQFLKAQY